MRRWWLVLAVAGCARGPAEPILDPIPGGPLAPELVLALAEVVTMPPSQPTTPPTDARLMRWARINYLGELPDGSGRLYVPDLNGKLYLIAGGAVREYLDVGARFAPDFWNHAGLGTGLGFVAFHPDF